MALIESLNPTKRVSLTAIGALFWLKLFNVIKNSKPTDVRTKIKFSRIMQRPDGSLKEMIIYSAAHET